MKARPRSRRRSSNELELGDSRIVTRRRLGAAERPVLSFSAGGSRAIALAYDQSLTTYTTTLSGGALERVRDGGWIGVSIGWLDRDRLLIAGRLLARRAVVAVSSHEQPRIVADALGDPVIADGDWLVAIGNDAAPFCGIRGYRGTSLVRELHVACDHDPRLICATAHGPPCLFASWEGERDVYRRFDPTTFAIGEPVFVDGEPAVGVMIDAALSLDGSLLAVPRPAGGITIVELATGKRDEIARNDGSSWQSASFIPGRRVLVATTLATWAHSRVVEVELERSAVRTLFVSTTGLYGQVRVGPDGDRLGVTHLSVNTWPVVYELGH